MRQKRQMINVCIGTKLRILTLDNSLKRPIFHIPDLIEPIVFLIVRLIICPHFSRRPTPEKIQ